MRVQEEGRGRGRARFDEKLPCAGLCYPSPPSLPSLPFPLHSLFSPAFHRSLFVFLYDFVLQFLPLSFFSPSASCIISSSLSLLLQSFLPYSHILAPPFFYCSLIISPLPLILHFYSFLLIYVSLLAITFSPSLCSLIISPLPFVLHFFSSLLPCLLACHIFVPSISCHSLSTTIPSFSSSPQRLHHSY